MLTLKYMYFLFAMFSSLFISCLHLDFFTLFILSLLWPLHIFFLSRNFQVILSIFILLVLEFQKTYFNIVFFYNVSCVSNLLPKLDKIINLDQSLHLVISYAFWISSRILFIDFKMICFILWLNFYMNFIFTMIIFTITS